MTATDRDFRSAGPPPFGSGDYDLVRSALSVIWHEFPIDTDPRAMDRALRALPPGLCALHALAWCDAEVRNGGYHQFFSNSWGALTAEAIDGYRLIGAARRAELLAAAAHAFFDDGVVSRDRAIRNRSLARPEAPDGEEWDEADEEDAFDAFLERVRPYEDEYYSIPVEELWMLAARYIRAHPTEFFR